MHHEIHTSRLLLRQWTDDDLEEFSAMCTDPDVMKYFPTTLSREESDAMASLCRDLISDRGWGFWAAQELCSSRFIGFIGLHIPVATLPCSPCVEVGWRLSKDFWGKGYATEGAIACLDFAFDKLKLSEVVAFTSVHNLPSEAVMRRLGMKRDASTFRHPALPEDHWLSEHCLYRIHC